MKRLFLLSLLITILGACSTVMLSPDMDRVKDKSAAWQEAYSDGCHSGYVAGGSLVHSFKRDLDRLLKDEDYKGGWKQGYRECYSDFRELCRSEALVSKADLYCSDVWQQGLSEEEEEEQEEKEEQAEDQ